MAIISTCEEYVLARLTQLEEENEKLNEENAELLAKLIDIRDEYSELYDLIKRRVKYTKYANSSWIDFESCYGTNKEFEELMNLFPHLKVQRAELEVVSEDEAKTDTWIEGGVVYAP